MNEKQSSSGISFLGTLALIFVVLKLTGNINWSWFWVLSPVILPFLFTVGLILFIVLVMWTR